MTSVGFPEERFGYNFMKKAETQKPENAEETKGAEVFGGGKTMADHHSGPQKASLPLLFPACLRAPCGLCDEGFWLRLCRAIQVHAFAFSCPYAKNAPKYFLLKGISI